ncbi:hypothetical protein BN1708_012995, partial [Verticillium longisporum]
MANHPWMPPLDTYHDEDFPYHQGRQLMITPHEAPEPFDGPSYYRPSDPSSTFDGDAVIKQHKTRSQLVAEHLPRGAAWPTDDGTKSSQHIGLTIEKTIKTTKERGSQVVVCKLNLGQMYKGIPARVVAKIYDPLYYPFLGCALPYASDVVRQADIDLSREAAVYQHFKTMGTDGQFAPKYYGAFTMPMRSNIAGQYRPVCLILLEYIDGSTMRALCTVPYNRIPALVPGPHAGNDDQRMLVMKELFDMESKMRHTGVVYGNIMPENVMISRPSTAKANAALKPRVVIVGGWKLATVECKEVNYTPVVELLPHPVSPIDWYAVDENDQFEGWIPLEYFKDEQKFTAWLEENFGGENAKNYCRQMDFDNIETPSYFNGRATTKTADLVGNVGS